MKLFSIGSLFILLTVAYTVTGKAIPELSKYFIFKNCFYII